MVRLPSSDAPSDDENDLDRRRALAYQILVLRLPEITSDLNRWIDVIPASGVRYCGKSRRLMLIDGVVTKTKPLVCGLLSCSYCARRKAGGYLERVAWAIAPYPRLWVKRYPWRAGFATWLRQRRRRTELDLQVEVDDLWVRRWESSNPDCLPDFVYVVSNVALDDDGEWLPVEELLAAFADTVLAVPGLFDAVEFSRRWRRPQPRSSSRVRELAFGSERRLDRAVGGASDELHDKFGHTIVLDEPTPLPDDVVAEAVIRHDTTIDPWEGIGWSADED